MRKIILAVLLAIFLPGLANAQAPRPRPGLTGNPVEDIKNAVGGGSAQSGQQSIPVADDKLLAVLIKPFQDLAAFLKNDVDAAAQLSVAVPELQDGNGLACWTAMRTAGKVFQAHPVPLTLHLASDFQNLRLIVMATRRLCDNPSCTLIFNDGVNIAVAAAPVTLPPPPVLQQLCAKVASIPVVPPSQADLDALKAATAPAATSPDQPPAPAAPAPAPAPQP